ncbi:MAG: 8-oxo-dGTP pyrophosphatase MutT (NUDIX family) [Cognaticolwellia sp.]|jgi:8-oxo-dGTP pyrophosphatase MutT (NUDIX family)
MYKIYINDKPIFLTNAEFGKKQKADEKNLVVLFRHRKSLFQYVDSLEKNNHFNSITIFSKKLDVLKEDFFSIYKTVEAAGGVVYNDHGEILMIYRRGFWDLPKGKMDEGESIEETAIREVQEEVGLNDIKIVKPLPTTFHTYRNRKDKRCIKPTYWFAMKTSETEVTLQTEEDIEDSIWIKPEDFLNSNKVAYGSISDVLKHL